MVLMFLCMQLLIVLINSFKSNILNCFKYIKKIKMSYVFLK